MEFFYELYKHVTHLEKVLDWKFPSKNVTCMSETKTLKTPRFKIKDPLKIKLKHLVFQPRFNDGVTMSIFTKKSFKVCRWCKVKCCKVCLALQRCTVKERTENLHRIGNTAPHGILPAPVLVEYMYMVTIIFSREAQNEHIKRTFIF